MDERHDVIVVGAGLAGLAAARLALRDGARTLVLDGQPPGGRARSDVVSGFTMNRGPHALYLGGPAERMLTDLGVAITGGPPAIRDAHGRRGELIAPLPGNVGRLMTSKLLGTRGKLALARLLATVAKLDPSQFAAVTEEQWLESLRLPADARELLAMLLRVATYANASHVVSAEVSIGQLQLALARGVRYLDGGWQSLVDGLAAGLEMRQVAAQAVDTSGSRPVVVTVDGDELPASSVIVASGTPEAAAAVLGLAPFDVGPPLRAACLDLGVDHVPSPPVLFGLDDPLYLSTHSPPARLAPAGAALVHTARYLDLDDDAPPALRRAELQDFARAAGIEDSNVLAARYLHRMTVVSAVATAESGGLSGRPSATASGADGVFLAGDWVGAEGHLADASLASAAAAARLAVAKVRV